MSYKATPPFGRPVTPPVRCCSFHLNVRYIQTLHTGTEAAVLIFSVQGPLCVNENNGYNVAKEKNYRQQGKT